MDRLAIQARTGSAAPAETPSAPPEATVAKIKNALRLTGVNGLGDRRGLRAGMTLADARAMVPGLVAHAAAPEEDCAFLGRIARWCDRYTPLVALDGFIPDAPEWSNHGLFLDVTGCVHLFGREGALRADLLRRLGRRGIEARAAIASTPGAAWALAHFGADSVCSAQVDPSAETALLADLPVAALRLSDAQIALADRLGLKRIGQLIPMPRAPLAARFGLSLIRRIDQALGAEDEPISPLVPVPALSAERRFAEPVLSTEAISATVRSLGERLAEGLELRGEGMRLADLTLFRSDGDIARAVVGTVRPTRDADLLVRLFAERLAALAEIFDTAGAGANPSDGVGFDMVRLSAVETERFDPAQIDLEGAGQADVDFHQLIDRLGARLGAAQIARPVPVESHIPERAVRYDMIGAEAKDSARAKAPVVAITAWCVVGFCQEGSREEAPVDWPDLEGPPARPVKLLSRPEPVDVMASVPDGPPVSFRWRRVLHRVVAAEGPERIAPEWWRDDGSVDPTRDYYRVEDESGRRFWLFRAGLYGQELGFAGVPDAGAESGTEFGPEQRLPNWYLHGLFS